MSEDPRCCGTGTCIISADGTCWCGQRWDGEKMCFPKPDAATAVHASEPHAQLEPETTNGSADHEA